MMLYKKKTRSTSASKAKTQVARRVLKKGRTDVQKKLDKKVLEAIIKTVLEKEKEIKKDNKIRLPKRYLNNLVETYAPVLPTLTLKSLENAVSYQRKKEMNLEQPQTVEPDQTKTDSTDPVQTNTDDKGRPKGTTQEMKLIKNVAYAAALNEVTQKVVVARHKDGAITRSIFNKILDEVTKFHKLISISSNISFHLN